MSNIIIIEDQTMLLEMIKKTIEEETDLKVIDFGNDAKDVVSLCEKNMPDIVLMDICTENNSSGITYCGILKNKYPNIKVIIMTGMPDVNFIRMAKENNADSFIYKNISKSSLISAIKNTLDGYSIYPDVKSHKDFKKAKFLNELTDKELEVLTLYSKLLDRQEVADNLNISMSTLKSHIASILQKTEFDSFSKLAIYCVSNGFIVTNIE